VGLVLAQDVIAPDSSPRFDNSAMDGYAVKSSSTTTASSERPVRLEVTGSAEIGRARTRLESSGKAIRIMTGSPIPDGADAVIKQEDVGVDGDFIVVSHPVAAGLEVRVKGEEVRAGDTALSSGTFLTPPAVAYLSGLGVKELIAYPKPRVSIVITGNEITPPKEGDQLFSPAKVDALVTPEKADRSISRAGTLDTKETAARQSIADWKIRDSNSVFLSSALEVLGVTEVRVSFSGDSVDEITEAVTGAMSDCDLLLVSGGVSVGPRDHVKEVFYDLGFKQVFWRVSQKPGKPLYFGTGSSGSNPYVFGLPGNAASVAFCFYEYVLPALKKMMGRSDLTMPRRRASLKCAVENDTGRTFFMKGKLEKNHEELTAAPVGHQGSHVLESLARSDCFIVIPIDAEHMDKGAEAEVHVLPWSDVR
jgi:molybdopterin molybdotransferase